MIAGKWCNRNEMSGYASQQLLVNNITACTAKFLFLACIPLVLWASFVFIGAYLVPYVILLLVIGIPLFFLELAVGQRMRCGSIGIWNYISPRLGGIGFASCVVSLAQRFRLVAFMRPPPNWPRSTSIAWPWDNKANYKSEMRYLMAASCSMALP